MKIIRESLALAKLQRTDMTEKAIVKSYKLDFMEVSRSLVGNKNPVRTVLDIGCGIAGWQCFLPEFAHPEIYLIDKTQLDENLYYGFKAKTSFYNSMEIAKKNLIANGVPGESIITQEATDDNMILSDEGVEFDLVVSFISCGFHYPIETYLDEIYEKLKKEGVFIVDLRKGTTGLEVTTKKFGNSEIIRETTTYQRVAFRK